MFDVFYSGRKPGLFAHEQEANSIEHAQQLSRTRYFWWVNYLTDYSNWDFLWEPVPWQSHQRHAWPSQWQKDSGTYLVPKSWNGSETNYRTDARLVRLPCLDNWSKLERCEFDTSWHPDPIDPPFIHEFATQWWDEGGPVYTVPGAQDYKYHNYPQAKLLEKHSNHWHTLEDCEFDYSWQPHPKDPPYIYVFGNQWWTPEIMPTVRYTVPGASQEKFVYEPRATLLESDRSCFRTLVPCEFDYSWCPDPGDSPYIYVFGNQWHRGEVMPTVEYHAPGATERKYVDWPHAKLLPDQSKWTVPNGIDIDSVDFSWVPDPGSPAFVYQFGTQHQKTGGPVYTIPGATEVSYVDHPRANKVSIDPCWTVPAGIDPESFDWTWHPDATEEPYIYQFATQHQKTGGPVYTVPGATEVKYLESISVKIESGSVPIVEIDHMDGNTGHIPNTVKRIRYFDNYRDTLIRLAKSLRGQYEFVWVCSSICDYSNFDFTWHPERWQSTMLHVFASDEQKFGDTFLMHVPTFAERAEKKALLEWYSVNFVPRIKVARRPIPVFYHNNDSHVDAARDTNFSAPLVLFTVEEHIDRATATVPLWRQEVKTITPISKGATAVIVPKAAVGDIKTQLYDYPYIDKTRIMLQSRPLDIVFISNGEPNAEENWQHLITTTKANMNSNLNRIARVDGINGRVAAYHAAARASTTPWFFAVFAKLHVNRNFDWSWQPDRMQQAKHYIFHALNPVNKLEYGHQAMIAYNRNLVLDNPGVGLDFTLDSEHEVVPVMSGTAMYNTSPWSAWRTAFREVIKLRHSLPDVESEYRMNQWLRGCEEEYGFWSQAGAEDAVEYYDSVSGDLAELRKSYEWAWLASYAFMRRGLAPDR